MSDFVYLEELCPVLRSKNAGPFLVTLDMIFKDREVYNLVKRKQLITKELISEIYNIPLDDVAVIEYVDAVGAVKATNKRKYSSGSPGDTDCYGMVQETPLLYLKFPRDTFEGLV